MRTTPKNMRRARDRRWLLADDLGSIVAVTDKAGRAIRINTQRPYGQPNTNNLGRFAGALLNAQVGLTGNLNTPGADLGRGKR